MVTTLALALLLCGSSAATLAAAYVPIMLREIQFDPKCAEPPAILQARLTPTSLGSTVSSNRNYYFVQFQGPVRAAWKRQAESQGAVLIQYVPQYAFITRMTASAASGVAALPCVRWVGPLPPQWKYPRALVSDSRRGLTVLVRLFPGETFTRVGSFVQEHKLWYLGFAGDPDPALRLRMPAGTVPQLAAFPEVAWIEEYKLPELRNDQGQRYLNVSNVSGLPWGVDVWQDYGLFGASQIVGIADTGLDTGNLSNLHPDFLDAAGNPRLVRAFALGRAATGDWSDPHGHGTHVTGSVLGNGTMSGSDPAARFYTGSFAGTAPEARLVFQSIGDASGQLPGIPLELGDLFDQAYGAGARVHTNSWGSTQFFGEYSYQSSMVDDYLWRHPEMTILFAAGNDGVDRNFDGVIDARSITPPATAKNCIAVGATESYRPPNSGWGGYANYTWGDAWPYEFPADPIASDYISDNPRGMAAFSSRGPCVDGRIKPDVAAPGTNIISCWSRGPRGGHSGVSTGWGIYDDWYIYDGGTSMATPLTAGTAALVREYYEVTRQHPRPTGALVKATLIDGALDLTPGQYGTGPQQEIRPRPDRSQGWGQPSIGRTLFPGRLRPGARLMFHDYGMITDTGMADTHRVTVTGTAAPLTITLVWTDAPGTPYAFSALVNDLDLVVTAPGGQVYYGNFGTTRANDRVNNVEHIELPTPAVGTYYVQVIGFNVADAPQPYALVMSGATTTAYAISGRVLDGQSAPVPGATITVETIGATPACRVTGSTRADGTYTINNLLPGSYRVTAAKEYYDIAPVERQVTVTNANVTGVNFTASLRRIYQISGYIRDDHGRGVPGATVTLFGPSRQVATTDAAGRYVFRLLPGGYYTVWPQPIADSFITPQARSIRLPSNESSMVNFWVSLLWYSMVDVYTLDPGRNPIPYAMVTLDRLDGSSWAVAQKRQTNSQGFVRLGGQELDANNNPRQILRQGQYRISVSKGHYAFQVFRTEARVQGPLPPMGPYYGLFTATVGAFYFWGAPSPPGPRYSASGLVRTLWDRPVADASVTLEGLSTHTVFHTHTQSTGFYSQRGMPTDVYRVTITKPGVAPQPGKPGYVWVFTPIDWITGLPNPDWDADLRVGPPANVPPVSDYALYTDPWTLAFTARDLDYQYPNGRQDYWAEKVTVTQ
jgi:subtilisin family serine protease